MRCIQKQFSDWSLRGILAAAVVFAFAASGFADTTPGIVSVEESWELVVSSPSPTADAPQVTCVISPVGNADSVHGMFIVNHHDVPTYAAGGLQLQVWSNDRLLLSQRAPNQALLATPGEQITWTQRMALENGNLVFEIRDGHSTTWGTFGGEDSLKLDVPTDLTTLGDFNPQVSVDNSGVSYAANRVQSLILRRVRVTFSNGDVVEDTTPRTVYPKGD